jgi:hypothetical protein
MIYDVKTDRFGVIQKEEDSIEQARQWAKTALGIVNPECVTAHRQYVKCDRCDSQPCACESS